MADRMIFKTKGDFLESIGKNRGDNKLVDRMIMRGEVVKTDEGYELVSPALEVEELKKKVKKLEDMIALYEKVHNENTEDYNRLLEEYEAYKKGHNNNPANPSPMSEEDKVNREYYMNLNEQKKEIIMSIIDDIYQETKARTKGNMQPEPEFKQYLYDKYGFSPREE